MCEGGARQQRRTSMVGKDEQGEAARMGCGPSTRVHAELAKAVLGPRFVCARTGWP